MSFLKLDKVVKRYGSVPVIHGVSLEAEKGEFVVFVGPSGCGKSTLLRMIAGLEEISAGDVSIDGRIVTGVAPADREVSMVFQSYALYPHMTVFDNIAFGLKMAKMSADKIAERVDEAAGILQIGPLLSRKPRQLSGGQRQRVAMGRAIVRDPKVFLFDEPLSNLDAKLRVQMRGEIKALHQRLKTTTVYVTHDQVEAMTMADRIVVMRGGIVEQVGVPLELYDHPANIFVAQFIGSPSMNIMEGRIVDGEFSTAEGIRFPLQPGLAQTEGSNFSYGIRPEHLAIAETGVPAEVFLVEPTGASTEVVVKIGKQQLVVVVNERLSLVPGQKINIRPNSEKASLFAADGRRVTA
jgi:multiple sugar transport system ATP-binding protein